MTYAQCASMRHNLRSLNPPVPVLLNVEQPTALVVGWSSVMMVVCAANVVVMVVRLLDTDDPISSASIYRSLV